MYQYYMYRFHNGQMTGQVCAVDIPDAQCHWYVQQADNTFGEGFDWENAPWFDVNGLNDVTNTSINSSTKITRRMEMIPLLISASALLNFVFVLHLCYWICNRTRTRTILEG